MKTKCSENIKSERVRVNDLKRQQIRLKTISYTVNKIIIVGTSRFIIEDGVQDSGGGY